MDGLTGSIVLVGAGKNGHALLSVLVKECDLDIIGVADSDPEAPGLELARQCGIPVAGDFREFLDKNPDIVINATSDTSIADEIEKYKAPNTEVIGGMCARLIGEMLGKRFEAQEKAKLHLEETKELYRIGVALTSAESLEDTLDTLLTEALRTLKATAGSVALYDEDTESLTLKASRGIFRGLLTGFPLEEAEGRHDRPHPQQKGAYRDFGCCQLIPLSIIQFC